MLKRISIVAAVAITMFAIAQSGGRVVGAVGRGAASNAGGRAGHFSFEVKKGMRPGGTEPVLDGRFEWVEVTQDPSRRFGIVIGRLTGLGVNMDNHVCEFGGVARMKRMTAEGPAVIEGRLQVRVVDRHIPDPKGGTGDPDIISWQFVSPANNIDLRFEGLVREGDIHVFAREAGK